jgi:hypothetical protein
VVHCPRVEADAQQHGNEHDRACQAGNPLNILPSGMKPSAPSATKTIPNPIVAEPISSEGRYSWWRKRIHATIGTVRMMASTRVENTGAWTIRFG